MDRTKMLIKDVHPDERPRERMLSEGARSLSNRELVAIILRTGSREESVLSLSDRMLAHFDGLRNLLDASCDEFTQIKGVGEAKATQLMAAIELGRRVNNLNQGERVVIKNPDDCADYLMNDMRFLHQEHFVVLYLNTKQEVIHKQSIFIGSLNQAIVHPREIFREGVKRTCFAIICVHNHPSGDPTPSKEDIKVTKRLVECGKVMGIELLDHVIIGDNKYISLKNEGYF